MRATKSAWSKADLAINGGTASVGKLEGKQHPKIGTEEFLALAEAWGFSPATRREMERILAAEENMSSPLLARYYNPNPSRVARLEEYARELFGSTYALGVNSGTSALNTAYVACGIGPGDEVIVPGYTFFATVAAVITAKAIPVIAEVDDSLTIDPADVERKITPQTKAIVPVHMAGNCSDMDSIDRIAKNHSLIVIEDNAQSCGGSFHGKMLGSIGAMGCFSLSSYKITGGGEAGLVLTDDEWLYTRAQNQHDTAACWRPDRYAVERQPGELFCGQNYRMSELEGAVNYIQLTKTKSQAQRYNTNMRRVLGGLDAFRATRPRRSNDIEGDVGYNFTLIAADKQAALEMIDALRAEGVQAGGQHGRPGSGNIRDWHIYNFWDHIMEKKTATPEGCPFTCPYYKGKLPAYSRDMCPNTLDYIARAVFIRINQWWSEADCAKVAEAINKVCGVLG